MLWWSPPRQRQRWGDPHVLPRHGTWQQIFFDLFYVAGCINLGTILKESGYHEKATDHQRALLYFVGTGFPSMLMWFEKLHYEARFTHFTGKDHEHGNDIFHRWLGVVQICAVATALSRIRSADTMSDMCYHNDMFLFALALFINSIVQIGQYLEVRLCVVDCDIPAAKVAARRDIERLIIPCLCYLAAALSSGYDFYIRNYGYDNEECQNMENSDLPIYLCLIGWWANMFIGYLVDVLAFEGVPYKQMILMTVPRNIHFCVHRKQEWFMLMFGESIISLIIVDSQNESPQYKMAFFAGVISVSVLAHWHYSTQPHSLTEHAFGRSRYSSYLYNLLIPIYSSALIVVGVSYKLFLHEYTLQDDSTHRALSANQGANSYWDGSSQGVQDDQYDDSQSSSMAIQDELRRQYAANLFCISMTVVLVSMDLRLLLHMGITKILERIQQSSKLSLFGFCIIRYTVVMAVATFSLHHNDPHIMAVCCLVAIILLELTSTIFLRLFRARKIKEDHGTLFTHPDPADGQHAMEDRESHSSFHLEENDCDDDNDDSDSAWFASESSTCANRSNMRIDGKKNALATYECQSSLGTGDAVFEGDECSTIASIRLPSPS